MAIGTQTIIAGTRGTYSVSANSVHVRDVDDKIKLLTPVPRPFTSLFMSNPLMEEETTGINGKFEWYEDGLLPSSTTLGTGGIAASAGGQTIAVSANIFRIGDTFLVESSNELFLVSAVGSLTVTASPALGGTATLATAGTVIHVQSPAFAEGSGKAVAISVLQVLKTGACQIIKHAVTMTGSQQASKMYGGADWKYQQQKKLLEAELKLEYTFLNNGSAYNDTSSPGTSISAGMNSLTSNVFSYPDPLTKAFFNASIGSAMANSSTGVTIMDNFKLYCGSSVLQDMDNFMTSIWQIAQQKESFNLKQYGILSTSHSDPKLVTYVHPLGAVMDVYYAPQLKGKFAHDIVGVNPDNVKRRYMASDNKGSRKYRFEMGIETPGDDLSDSQYLMHQGLQIGLEETHFRIKKS